MKIVEPVTISDGDYTASNIVEDIPRASSSTTYNNWDTATTYSTGNVVCAPYQVSGMWRFGVFTAITGSTGIDPNVDMQGNGNGGGPEFWTLGTSAALYDAAISYGLGQMVGHQGGSTGAYYYSKTAANVNHTPPSSSTYWQQTTPYGYNTWSSGTTYASGDQVVILTGQLAQIYQSLQASNTNHAPASSPTWWDYLGATWKPWDSTTTYAVGNRVIDLRNHHTYESLQGTNLNKDPTTGANTAWWLDLGTNNKWALFDLSNSSVTSSPDTVEFTVHLPASCDTLALLNMLATEVQITASTVGGGTLYSQTIDLTDAGDASADRLYYHDSDTKESHLIVTELPTNADLTVAVVITNAGTGAQVGVALFGTADEIGDATYGASLGIISFSRKEADGFGNYSLVPRASSLRPKFTVVVNSVGGNADRVFFKLKRLDAVPALFIGSDDRAATWAFGFYRSFEELLSYPTKSYYSIEIEGLT